MHSKILNVLLLCVFLIDTYFIKTLNKIFIIDTHVYISYYKMSNEKFKIDIQTISNWKRKTPLRLLVKLNEVFTSWHDDAIRTKPKFYAEIDFLTGKAIVIETNVLYIWTNLPMKNFEKSIFILFSSENTIFSHYIVSSTGRASFGLISEIDIYNP